MNRQWFIALFLNLCIIALTIMPFSVLATDSAIRQGLDSSATEAQFQTDVSIFGFSSVIIRTVLGTTGIIVLLLVVYAGMIYLSAAGNPDKIKRATNILISAALGLVVIFGAYSIANFVVGRLQSSTLSQ